MSSKVKISFGRVFWPSLVSGIVLMILFFVFLVILIASLTGGKKPYSIKNNTVLHLTLSAPIDEVSDNGFDPNTFQLKSTNGLSELLYGFERAADDDRVAGVFLDLNAVGCGFARATEIRNAIKQFKASGKFVVAYLKGEAVGLKQYYVASAADEIYGFPSSMFDFGGLGTEVMFYKGLFDKLAVEIQVVRGSNNDFKSAVEPFFLEQMSDSSRVQIQRYLTSIWEDVTLTVGNERGIDIDKLNYFADSTIMRRLSDAAEHNLIDEVMYKDEIMGLLAEKVNVKSVNDLRLESFEKYAQNKFNSNQKIVGGKKPNIAIVVAEGTVSRQGDGLSAKKVTKQLRKVREDEKIKAVVLRVNSPGGSALASDEIWREVMLTKAEKPVIVSMGDLAASGGYFISAPGDKIFAQSSTITGSIGVFGMIPYTGDMFENKLGITFDRVGTNARSVLSLNKRLSEEEFAIVQEEVDFIYDQFLDRVVEGRGMTKEQVNEIARGRVWTGKDALEIGLIDEIGGIKEAVDYAGEIANIPADDVLVQLYPKRKVEPWMEILEALDDKDEESSQTIIPEELIEYYTVLRTLEERTGIQARLPFDIKF